MIKFLVNRYLALESPHALDYNKISQALGLKFSKEFKEINSKGRFDYLTSFEWFNTDGDTEFSAISRTLFLRSEHNLPDDILFLAEDGASLLFMKCFGDHEEIYWIAIEDFERFCNGEPLEYDYTYFPNFIEFFKFLLDEEEKSREEE